MSPSGPGSLGRPGLRRRPAWACAPGALVLRAPIKPRRSPRPGVP
jgi:hypothetical protein